MKILFICKQSPWAQSNGIEVKIVNLLRCLEQLAVVTSFFLDEECSAVGVPGATVRPSGESRLARGWSAIRRYLGHLRDVLLVTPTLQGRLERVVKESGPDLIWLEFGYICHLIPFLKRYRIPIFYGSHNSQFMLDRQLWQANSDPLNRFKMTPFLAIYLLQERLFMPMADKLLCISPRDLEYYARFIARDKLALVSFFFDCRQFQQIAPCVPEHPYICMVGSLRSYQNYLATLYALEKLWPLLESVLSGLRLYVIGELPEEGSREHRLLMQKQRENATVVFTGRVATVIPYVKGALVNIVPLTIGSGVRTKIIESSACRTPVVSTSVGAEGLPFESGRSILIADEPRKFADHVISLVNNERLRVSVVEEAYQTYLRELSLEAGTQVLARLLAGAAATD